FTKYVPDNRWVPWICVVCPLITWWIDNNSDWLLGGFQFGFLNLALNGLLIFIGLRIVTVGRVKHSL
ncbi:MAG TPA: hypothetical protein PLR24_09725, partial [Saprospiraceae bacterium]|nr:hypothetical protein [Saprospiraceae bacterium]